MEFKYNLKIKMNETKHLFIPIFGKESSKRSIFEAAAAKIAACYNKAKSKDIYANILLLQIKNDLDELINRLREQSKIVKQLLEKTAVNLSDINGIKSQIIYQSSFSNPVNFALIQLIQKFDKCIMLLLCAKNSGCFTASKDFYQLKKSLKKDCWRTLTKIMRVELKTQSAKK